MLTQVVGVIVITDPVRWVPRREIRLISVLNFYASVGFLRLCFAFPETYIHETFVVLEQAFDK
jgi:hypothetical protein